ncbi:hypothetical protein PENTCL1PPCAC_13682, partial [Pristionchus entomophagus]
ARSLKRKISKKKESHHRSRSETYDASCSPVRQIRRTSTSKPPIPYHPNRRLPRMRRWRKGMRRFMAPS